MRQLDTELVLSSCAPSLSLACSERATASGHFLQVILMAGLQGVGKTTACGKLALALKKENRKVLLVATDVYRPAAIEQLQLLGKRCGVEVFDLGTEAKPVQIAEQGIAKARQEDFDTVIVDTAGRLQVGLGPQLPFPHLDSLQSQLDQKV